MAECEDCGTPYEPGERAAENMRSEASRRETLEWLADYDYELMRLHRKLDRGKSITRAEKEFLSFVVFFVLGETIRVDDEAATGNN